MVEDNETGADAMASDIRSVMRVDENVSFYVANTHPGTSNVDPHAEVGSGTYEGNGEHSGETGGENSVGEG
jgi:hypothetical protein